MERVKVAEAECGNIASVSRDAWMLDELKDEVGAVIPEMSWPRFLLRILSVREAS
ncbi:MAG: hypothetical protein ACLRX5_05655 [Slackia sp.]